MGVKGIPKEIKGGVGGHGGDGSKDSSFSEPSTKDEPTAPDSRRQFFDHAGSSYEDDDGSSGGSIVSGSLGTMASSKQTHATMESLTKMKNRTISFAAIVFLIGCGASFAFIWFGITAAQDDTQDEFSRHAEEVTQELESAWNDYEIAGMWVHEACRDRDFTRQQFYELYQYVKDGGSDSRHASGEDYIGGLDFQAIEFIPNVTHAERVEMEREAEAYFSEKYPDIVYGGFRGIEPDSTSETGVSVQSRSEQPFYFPVHYVEPVEPNAGAIDFDLYSSASRRTTIHEALDSWKPALTPRLRLVQETEPGVYSVLLMHPGIRLKGDPNAKARDISTMVIRIPSLLERAARFQVEHLAVYIFDTTDDSAPAQFLGGAALGKGDDFESTGQAEFRPKSTDEVQFRPEIEYDALVELVSSYSDIEIFVEELNIGSKTWDVVVIPLEGTYEPDLRFIIFAGVMIFVAATGLAGGLYQNIRKTMQMDAIVRRGAIETAIVKSLFPKMVHDRLMDDAKQQASHGQVNPDFTAKVKGRSGTKEVMTSEEIFGSNPIADLFPETTLMFCDLVGFTSWSSMRDPTQVFTLLETIYHSFDSIAARRKIFKVETVGDCYIAACGLPDAREDHARAMCRFAVECLHIMSKLTRALETKLGPDTADLDVRIGLHSGPVTAGVLRGDKGRFQLFGDTVNMASRMESTGVRGKIHVSRDTAMLLQASGNGDWLSPRKDKVTAKGLGEMTTYWLVYRQDKLRVGGALSHFKAAASSDDGSLGDTSEGPLKSRRSKKESRLISWNVEILGALLKNVQARRAARGDDTSKPHKNVKLPHHSINILEEVQDIVALPEFDATALKNQVDPSTTYLDPEVLLQLEEYIMIISSSYRSNPFHNFEHASHVMMSVTKLLSRIVNPKEAKLKKSLGGTTKYNEEELDAWDLHDHTFGITSDPLTQFACVFSALIHDVDHQGVPNACLVKEETELAKKFKNKSVAEQNSVDMAWELLMQSKFTDLRECIASDEAELLHFRQLVVNSVMATDIVDKDLGALRKARWNKAFNIDQEGVEESALSVRTARDDKNRKATIVIEHLIQASDIAHTMQHWHVYLKWNERFFHEQMRAFKQGRLETDPSLTWYEGEKGFFDFYIIPLAHKLDTCGVFGVSSTEYLSYAQANRCEWELKGKEVVKGYLRKYHGDEGNNLA